MCRVVKWSKGRVGWCVVPSSLGKALLSPSEVQFCVGSATVEVQEAVVSEKYLLLLVDSGPSVSLVYGEDGYYHLGFEDNEGDLQLFKGIRKVGDVFELLGEKVRLGVTEKDSITLNLSLGVGTLTSWSHSGKPSVSQFFFNVKEISDEDS